MLVTRGANGPQSMTAREALRVATRGGAACLGRDDLGSIEAGKRADVALFAVDGLGHAGAEADPVAAVVHCAPRGVRHLFVEGQAVVRGGRLVRADEEDVAAEGHRLGRLAAERDPSRVRGSMA
jgi:cytosine/adenosine deaminase-related metal-dependent hydrolase